MILKIARMGNPILRNVAHVVRDPLSPEVASLVASMIETMEDASGAGLAAPQVHVPLRIVIFHVPSERNSGEKVPLTVLINPEVSPLTDQMDEDVEACLSLPGLAGTVPRYRSVRYLGVDLSGAPIDRIAEGFHARVVQHETDHLDGILYPQRMGNMRTLGFVDELKKSILQEEQPTASRS